MRTRAVADIEAERQRALAEVRDEVAELALLAAGKVVGETMDGERERRLVRRVPDPGLGDRARERQDLVRADPSGDAHGAEAQHGPPVRGGGLRDRRCATTRSRCGSRPSRSPRSASPTPEVARLLASPAVPVADADRAARQAHRRRGDGRPAQPHRAAHPSRPLRRARRGRARVPAPRCRAGRASSRPGVSAALAARGRRPRGHGRAADRDDRPATSRWRSRSIRRSSAASRSGSATDSSTAASAGASSACAPRFSSTAS